MIKYTINTTMKYKFSENIKIITPNHPAMMPTGIFNIDEIVSCNVENNCYIVYVDDIKFIIYDKNNKEFEAIFPGELPYVRTTPIEIKYELF